MPPKLGEIKVNFIALPKVFEVTAAHTSMKRGGGYLGEVSLVKAVDLLKTAVKLLVSGYHFSPKLFIVRDLRVAPPDFLNSLRRTIEPFNR